jgi:hypothetical protein
MSKYILAFGLLAVLIFIAACGAKTSSVDTGKVIKSAPIGTLTVALSSSSGQIKHGGDEFFVTFKDSSGKPVDVGAAAFTFHMPQILPRSQPRIRRESIVPRPTLRWLASGKRK